MTYRFLLCALPSVHTIGVHTIGIHTIGIHTIGIHTIGIHTIGIHTIDTKNNSDTKELRCTTIKTGKKREKREQSRFLEAPHVRRVTRKQTASLKIEILKLDHLPITKRDRAF